MSLSQEKNNNFIHYSQRSNYQPKDDFISSKVNVFPPKMTRVASFSSHLYSEESNPTSLSQESKPARNFSKNKSSYLVPSKTMKDSYNSQLELTKTLSNKDLLHRYSCNYDWDKNVDFLKTNEKMYFSTDRRNEQDLESRVRELEEKMRKNEENLKFYSEEIGNFKMQFSTSSSSNLLDSISTNTFASSIRDPLKEISSIQCFNNKENFNKNILSVESITNSPKGLEIENKVKEIDLLKKSIQKLNSRQEKNEIVIRKVQESMKEGFIDFKDYLEKTFLITTKRQEKIKNKIFEEVKETINQKLKEIETEQSEKFRKILEDTKEFEEKNKVIEEKLQVGKERFVGNPILIKVREEIYGLVKKQNQVNSFNSYVDMIKRSINNDLGKQMPFSSMQTYKDSSQNNALMDEKVVLEEVETTYYLDPEGYLLDSEGYYLVKNNDKVKLTPNQLQKLQENKILN